MGPDVFGFISNMLFYNKLLFRILFLKLIKLVEHKEVMMLFVE